MADDPGGRGQARPRQAGVGVPARLPRRGEGQGHGRAPADPLLRARLVGAALQGAQGKDVYLQRIAGLGARSTSRAPSPSTATWACILLGEILERVAGRAAGVVRPRAHPRSAGHEGHALPAPAPSCCRASRPPSSRRAAARRPASWCTARCTTRTRSPWAAWPRTPGLFGTAPDLARFAQMLLNGGVFEHQRIVSRATLERFTRRAGVPGLHAARWAGTRRGDNNSAGQPPLARARSATPASRAPRCGWTPSASSSSSCSPTASTPRARTTPSARCGGRWRTRSCAAWPRRSTALAVICAGRRRAGVGRAGRRGGPAAGARRAGRRAGRASTWSRADGAGALRGQARRPHRPRRLGDRRRARRAGRAARRRASTCVRLFAPEHGLAGRAAAGETVADGGSRTAACPWSASTAKRRPGAGGPGRDRRPRLDLQDAGVRFYTYASDLILAWRRRRRRASSWWCWTGPTRWAANASRAPRSDPAPSRQRREPRAGAAGARPHRRGDGPLRERAPRASPRRLTVVPMAGWKRAMTWADTGRAWVPPSPNLRTAEAALAYPGTCLLEATNVTEGRGTEAPFLLVGAPWVDAEAVRRRVAVPGLRAGGRRASRRAPGPGRAAAQARGHARARGCACA